MPLDMCPACRGLNFKGWHACEDCGCPRDAAIPGQKAHWAKHKSSHLARINPNREPPVHHARPQGRWRVIGLNPDGSICPVWKDDPIDEAQAREWVGWTERRVAAGKAAFLRVTLLDPQGTVVLERNISAPTALVVDKR